MAHQSSLGAAPVWIEMGMLMTAVHGFVLTRGWVFFIVETFVFVPCLRSALG